MKMCILYSPDKTDSKIIRWVIRNGQNNTELFFHTFYGLRLTVYFPTIAERSIFVRIDNFIVHSNEAVVTILIFNPWILDFN